MRKPVSGRKIRVGIIGCAGILLAACGSTASTGDKTAKANLGDVTSQQARQVIAQYNAENNAANESVSTTVQAQDETGYALEADNALFRYNLQSGYGPAWEKTHYKPFYEHAIQLQSIQSQGWPRRFAAITAQTSSKNTCDELLVFIQNHSKGKWKLQNEPLIAPSEASKVELSSVGSPLPINDHNLAVAPGALGEQLTGQLSVWANGGVSPSLLPASVMSSGCSGLLWLKTAKKDYGLTGGGNWTFTATAVPASSSQAIQSYAVRGGGVIVSVVAKIDLIDSEPPHSSAYMTNSSTIGNIIKGVHYSSNTYPFISDVAVYDPPRGHGQPKIIGSYTTMLWPATGVLSSGN
jgi:hypothetical protein